MSRASARRKRAVAERGLRYQLIVFDWDGTLSDSAGIIVRSLQRACAETPDVREPWIELARHCMKQRDWQGGV